VQVVDRWHLLRNVREVGEQLLEEENHKLKQFVADLSLDTQMLQEVLRTKL
jgi:hypothetical protein